MFALLLVCFVCSLFDCLFVCLFVCLFASMFICLFAGLLVGLFVGFFVGVFLCFAYFVWLSPSYIHFENDQLPTTWWFGIVVWWMRRGFPNPPHEPSVQIPNHHSKPPISGKLK